MFFSERFEVLYAIAHYFGWNREPESLGRNALRGERHFSGTDSDQPARDVDDRPAAVARINRGIRLHEGFVFDVIDRDVAFGSDQHTAADRTSVTDCVANDEDRFAQ